MGQVGNQAVRQALSYCLEQICSPTFRWMGDLQFGHGLVDDVISLGEGSEFREIMKVEKKGL